MGPTDYAKWQQLESRLNSEASTLLQDEEEDELTRKNKRDLEANCRGLITDELQPFVEKWGLSLDLALCLACKENQKDLVEQLLKHGANPNAVDPRGRSCLKLSLRYAVSARPVITLLLDHKAEVYSCTDRLKSCNSGLLRNASTRVDSRRLVTTGNNEGKQSTDLAVAGGATKTARNITSAEDNDGKAGVDENCEKRSSTVKSDDASSSLRPVVEDELSALAQASAGEDCDVGVIEYLINNAAWPNDAIKQKTLDHALFYACQKGTGRICRTLIACKADPWGFREDAAGLTCLHYWSAQADVALISTAVLGLTDLIERNKKQLLAPAVDTAGRTDTDDDEAVKNRKDAQNADAPTVDKVAPNYYRSVNDVVTLNGETPLHIAVRANCLPAVRLLLSFGFELTKCSVNGHMAMNLFQSAEMFELLYSSGGKDLLNVLPEAGSTEGPDGDGRSDGFSPLLAAIVNNALFAKKKLTENDSFATQEEDSIALRILDHDIVDVNLEGSQLPLTAAVRKNRSFRLIEKMVRQRRADVNKIEQSTRVPTLVLACTSSASFADIGTTTCFSSKSNNIEGGAPAGGGELQENENESSAGAGGLEGGRPDVVSGSTFSISTVRDYDDDPSLPWQLQVVNLLLEHNADPLLEDCQGFNAVTRCQSPKLLRALLDHFEIENQKILLQCVPSCGKSALVLASSSNNVGLISLLIAKMEQAQKSLGERSEDSISTDVATTRPAGKSSPQSQTRKACEELSCFLNDPQPVTPLIAAAANCHLEACTILVQKGADVDFKLKGKKRAIDFVDKTDARYADLCKLLKTTTSDATIS
ncbi:unnamed protein product [Amoebophrya sp. A120]|nr:unnamed protein product [Amoebophrya sp. A120]|eukprot:GSA120T00006695001.1